MAFFRSAWDHITSIATTGSTAYSISDLSPDKIATLQTVDRIGYIQLCKSKAIIQCILYNPNQCKKAYSMFRFSTSSTSEATALFADVKLRLAPIFHNSYTLYTKRDVLEEVWKTFLENKSFYSAHLAAKCNLPECFTDAEVKTSLNLQDELGRTPLIIAVQQQFTDTVRTILDCQPDVSLHDNEGNTCLHHAADTTATIVMLLLMKAGPIVNRSNDHGEIALLLSAKNGDIEIAKRLLEAGSDVNIPGEQGFAIHYAVRNSQNAIVELICEQFPHLVNLPDQVEGASPLHLAKTKDTVDLLLKLGANINSVNKEGVSVLLHMIRRKENESVMQLLLHDANPNLIGNDGNSALHFAIETKDVDLVRSLIVFGADVNSKNKEGNSCRHCAANVKGDSAAVLVYSLHCIGAERCAAEMNGCADRCRFGGHDDGSPDGEPLVSPSVHKQLLEDAISTEAVHNCLTRSNSSLLRTDVVGGDASKEGLTTGSRLLCLDGGGIRGLVLCQLLIAIEAEIDQPIHEVFDWIAGTSTGGILALGLAVGRGAKYIRCLYFRLKDAVFKGNRPYPSEPLENFMKTEFGEHTRMASITDTRVLVSATLADRGSP